MSEPFEPEPDRRPRQQELVDLPAPLAAVQQRLQRLRPRQPQLDLALLNRLATADQATPPRVATGFSRMQLALAVAAGWLCGVIFGATLLLGIGYRSSRAPSQNRLAATDARELAPASMEKTATGSEMAEGGVVADAEIPMIAAATAPTAASAVQARQLPAITEPDQREAAHTVAGGVSHGLTGIGELDWESPLRANSLRKQRNQQVFVRAYQRSNRTETDLSPLDQSPVVAPATSASAPNSVPNISTHQPTVPKTRKQWMNDLLAIPSADIH